MSTIERPLLQILNGKWDNVDFALNQFFPHGHTFLTFWTVASLSDKFKTSNASDFEILFFEITAWTPPFLAFCTACEYAAGIARANIETPSTATWATTRAIGPRAILVYLQKT